MASGNSAADTAASCFIPRPTTENIAVTRPAATRPSTSATASGGVGRGVSWPAPVVVKLLTLYELTPGSAQTLAGKRATGSVSQKLRLNESPPSWDWWFCVYGRTWAFRYVRMYEVCTHVHSQSSETHYTRTSLWDQPVPIKSILKSTDRFYPLNSILLKPRHMKNYSML